jgi:hypothetical protein
VDVRGRGLGLRGQFLQLFSVLLEMTDDEALDDLGDGVSPSRVCTRG